MRCSLCSVKDVKSGFSDPCGFRSLEIAKAQFISFLGDVNSSPESYFVPASDLQLWHVGEFDSDSGLIEPCAPTLLVSGDSVKFKEVSNEE